MRGGAQTVLPKIKSGENWSVTNAYTGGGMVDFRYAYYGEIGGSCFWGFTIGLGAGASSESLEGTETDRFTNRDYDGSLMDYTVQSEFSQTTLYARTELSMMLAFYFGPVSLNIGPRFVIPVATGATMKVTDLSVSAYYRQYGVTVSNQKVIGMLDLPYSHKVQADRPFGILLVGAELGYEWQVGRRSSVGLQAYADISVLNAGSPLEPSSEPMIDVSPIVNKWKPIPEIEVHSITNYVGDLRSLEFGLRVYYAFSTQPQYNRRRYR